MPEAEDWEFPEGLRPRPDNFDYDMESRLGALLSLSAEVPEESFTADTLGTEREGNAILIDDSGLIVTIGYLVVEAETIWLRTNAGQVVPGHLMSYDFDSGFGLVQALETVDAEPFPLGVSAEIAVGARVVVAGQGGLRHALEAQIVGKREFAGYWEYVLDEAFFTTPVHPNWGGAAMITSDGRLGGIGSLYVQDARGTGQPSEGNMIVPIDLLPPLIAELRAGQSVRRSSRPWVGFYVTEAAERLVVAGIIEGGPAHRAGIEAGDIVLEVAGAPVGDLSDLFRTIWSVGPAGCDIPLTLWRDGKARRTTVGSADRNSFLTPPRLH